MSNPEFDISDFDSVIREHDDKVHLLNNWRRDFIGHADDLADYLTTYPGISRAQKAHLASCFRGNNPSPGHQATFDPWNGVWRGTWNGVGNTSEQYHLWDLTSQRDRQFVQPVTQSTSDYVTRSNLAEKVALNKVDLGINVWSQNNGLTGWVSKRQGNDPHELPHIAYSPDAHTLIWIAQKSFTGAFWMFHEWVNPSGTQYGIYGKTFTLGPNGVVTGGVLGQAAYNSVRRDSIQSPSGQTHTVVRGDSLSLITRRYWTDMMLFPLIYDANASVIGADWNLIHPGMVLTIPDKSSYTQAQLATARQRARSGQ